MAESTQPHPCPMKPRAVQCTLPRLVRSVTRSTPYTSAEAERAVHALFCIYGDTASVERMVAEFIACAGG